MMFFRARFLVMTLLAIILCSFRVSAQDVLNGDPVNFLDQDRYGPGTLIAAMEILASDYSTEATEPLRALLAHPDEDVARMAAWLLRSRGDYANSVSAAAEQLANQDNSIEVRSNAALSLGVLRSAAGMAPLITALNGDPAYLVRLRAAEAIGKLHRIGGAQALSSALAGDESHSVRTACARALASAPDVDPSSLLLALSDSESGVRRESAWSLGRIKALDAVGNLVGVLQNDPDCQVRSAAAWALGEIGDPIAKQALDAAKNGSCAVAAQAAAIAAMKFH